MTIRCFQPTARTLVALARPTVGHPDPQSVAAMDEIEELLRYAFRTQNRLTMSVPAPGSPGMEAGLYT